MVQVTLRELMLVSLPVDADRTSLYRLGEENASRIRLSDETEKTRDTELSETVAQRLSQNRHGRISRNPLKIRLLDRSTIDDAQSIQRVFSS